MESTVILGAHTKTRVENTHQTHERASRQGLPLPPERSTSEWNLPATTEVSKIFLSSPQGASSDSGVSVQQCWVIFTLTRTRRNFRGGKATTKSGGNSQWHPPERVDREEDGARIGVYHVFDVPLVERVQDGRLVKVRQNDQVIHLRPLLDARLLPPASVAPTRPPASSLSRRASARKTRNAPPPPPNRSRVSPNSRKMTRERERERSRPVNHHATQCPRRRGTPHASQREGIAKRAEKRAKERKRKEKTRESVRSGQVSPPSCLVVGRAGGGIEGAKAR